MTRSSARGKWVLVTLLAVVMSTAPATTVRVRTPASDATVWRDRSAKELMQAAKTGDPQAVFDALASADCALQIDPKNLPALRTYARVMEAIGVRNLATRLWRDYLELETNDDARLAAYREQRAVRWPLDQTTRWHGAMTTLNAATAPSLVREFPEQARRWAEGDFLSRWAEAVENCDTPSANGYLDKARFVGRALREISHETLLAESVAAIDDAKARADDRRIYALVEGHLAYRSGRVLFAQHAYAHAAGELMKARNSFAAASSPMKSVAAFFFAGTVLTENQPATALQMLRELASAERMIPGHRALLASELWYIGMCEAAMARRSRSIDAAEESLRIFDALGERGNAAAIHLILATNLAYLGDQLSSQRHLIAAMNDASIIGDQSRLLVALGSASSAELRRQRWQSARALAAIELKLEGHTAPPEFVATSLARLAVAEYRLGHITEADAMIDRPRTVACRINDDALRMQLTGDITALHAAMLRDRDPRQAIDLLSASIGFHKKIRTAFALPELYLERGRCRATLGDDDGALRDFHTGIDELEAQRTTVRETSLRAGMFDDSRALFTETVRLLLRRRDIPQAFFFAERGRARALLDQLGLTDSDNKTLITTEEHLRAKMPTNTVLIEYVTLPDELIIFTADRRRLSATEVPINATEIEKSVGALLRAMSERRPPKEVRRLSTSAYGRLLQPIDKTIAGAERIVIVADGSLQRLPFSILTDPVTHAYLIERAEVLKAPSASVFLKATDEYRRRARHAPETAVIFADPVTSEAQLPMAKREGRTIAGFYRRTTLFTQERATRENFTKNAPLGDVVHFAGHALVNNADARNSALLLTGGTLDSADIAACSFQRTRLVVLAACSTMVGPTTTAEGTTSIARAFLVGGVPSVIGTLWDVDDAVVSRIAYDFHTSFARGESPATALRSASLRALRSSDSDVRRPSSWGAFELAGAAGP